MIEAQFDQSFEGWRQEARKFLTHQIPPANIEWNLQTPSLFGGSEVALDPATSSKTIFVPPEFMELAEAVACARDADRWDLLYRVLYRLQHENKNLLKISVDPDVHRLSLLNKSVRRDIHKMHAFVRFKKVLQKGEDVYVAWHKPEHIIHRLGTPFFARRFGDRRWSIFTPDGSAHWDLKELTFGPGMEQSEFQVQDDWDDVWKSYYKNIFNPSRIKIKMMKAEMSPKYWASLPEASLIPELVRNAPLRLQTMAANHNKNAQVDPQWSLQELKERAHSCTACPLHARATQTVFGSGASHAEIMIVGEQPGDMEDQSGEPLVGPAGRVFADALQINNLRREDLYLTNAVKHFKWQESGKLRLHQRPNGAEMHACKPWLEAEIKKVRPQIILALGNTAALAVLGRLSKVSEDRGKVFRHVGGVDAVIVSWHPAAILRAQDPAQSEERFSQLVSDLALARSFVDLHKLRP